MLRELTPWIPFLSLIFVALTFYRTTQKDKADKNEQEEKTFDSLKESLLKVNIKLDQVNATTSETRSDIKKLNKDLSDIDRRVTVLESKVNEVTK